MRSLTDEQRIKNLAQKFWEISGHQNHRSDEFYFLAEQVLAPYIGESKTKSVAVYYCDACGKKFTDEVYENSNWGFNFCSKKCEEDGPSI